MIKNFLWILLLIGLDQGAKVLARVHLAEPIEITSFFQLQLAKNTGIAFSFPVPLWILIIVTALVLIFLLAILITKKLSLLQTIVIVLIFVGATGNLIDRVFFGAVIDFLKFWSFPIFNLADVMITVGAGLFLFEEIFLHKKNSSATSV